MGQQVAEKWPSAALSGRLTVSTAWQEVAPYSSRRHPLSFVVAANRKVRLRPAHQLAGVARSRSLFVATPLSGFREPPQSGISQSSTCICLPAEALAQAGPFLSNLEKMTFSADY
jgi:hypothetical protein